MLTWTYWKQALERVFYAALTTAAGYIVADGFDFRTADWGSFANVVLVAAIAGLGYNTVTSAIGPKNSPSPVATTPKE